MIFQLALVILFILRIAPGNKSHLYCNITSFLRKLGYNKSFNLVLTTTEKLSLYRASPLVHSIKIKYIYSDFENHDRD